MVIPDFEPDNRPFRTEWGGSVAGIERAWPEKTRMMPENVTRLLPGTLSTGHLGIRRYHQASSLEGSTVELRCRPGR